MSNPLPEGGLFRHINPQIRVSFQQMDDSKKNLEESTALLRPYLNTSGSKKPLDSATYNQRILDAITVLSKDYSYQHPELITLARRVIVETVNRRPDEIWRNVFGTSPVTISAEKPSHLSPMATLLKGYQELMRNLKLLGIQDPYLEKVLEGWQSFTPGDEVDPNHFSQDFNTVCFIVRNKLQALGIYSEEKMHQASEIEVSLAHLQDAVQNYASDWKRSK